MKDFSPAKISKQEIGIIGSGIMGQQLAQFLLIRKSKVLIKTRNLHKTGSIYKNIKTYFLKRQLNLKYLANLEVTDKWGNLKDCELIIECTPENHYLKQNVFTKLGAIGAEKSIIATNTSSFTLASFKFINSIRSRVIGLHFFNPVEKLDLVELLLTPDTAEWVTSKVKKFLKQIKKIPILVKDTPGFIVNRLLFTQINDAAYMVDENLASVKDVDQALKIGLNHPLGPFEIADLVGVDTTYRVITNLHNQLNTRGPAKIFRKLINQGRLGKKTGYGFYKYK